MADKISRVINLNTEILCGEAWSMTMVLKDNNGTVINLTGYTYHMSIYDRPGGTLLVSPTVAIVAGSGQVTFSLTPAQTTALRAAKAVYSILSKQTATPTNIRELFRGEIDIYPVITVVSSS